MSAIHFLLQLFIINGKYIIKEDCWHDVSYIHVLDWQKKMVYRDMLKKTILKLEMTNKRIISKKRDKKKDETMKLTKDIPRYYNSF